jgi:hypothetical protein
MNVRHHTRRPDSRKRGDVGTKLCGEAVAGLRSMLAGGAGELAA